MVAAQGPCVGARLTLVLFSLLFAGLCAAELAEEQDGGCDSANPAQDCDADASANMMQLRRGSSRAARGACASLNQDPYHGGYTPCCPNLDQCIGKWGRRRSNGEYFYKCMAGCCTPEGDDPYGNGNDFYLECCSGLEAVLGFWGTDSNHYKCVSTDSPTPAPTTITSTTTEACTHLEEDPWAYGYLIPCCSGLDQCLGQWEGIYGPWYYLCFEVCPNTDTTSTSKTTTTTSFTSGPWISTETTTLPPTVAPTAPTLAPTAEPTPLPPCTDDGFDPYSSGIYIPCCEGLEECLGDWNSNKQWHWLCLPSCTTTTTSTTTRFLNVTGSYRLLTFNVWWQNYNYDAIANMIAVQVGAEIVNLQEAIQDMPDKIVEALNRLNMGTWKLGNPWSSSWYWCGLNAYRSDIWYMEWHKEVSVRQDGDTRGNCGVLLRRKSDSTRVCVWGTHPVWRSGGTSWWAKDVIIKSADSMKECSSYGAPSVFMCDCNTNDWNAVRRQLDESTGWRWRGEEIDGYDQIFGEEAPQDLGYTFDGGTICSNCGQRGCQAGCSNANWAYSDHPPVFVNVSNEHRSVRMDFSVTDMDRDPLLQMLES